MSLLTNDYQPLKSKLESEVVPMIA